jgi:hypothetical protein
MSPSPSPHASRIWPSAGSSCPLRVGGRTLGPQSHSQIQGSLVPAGDSFEDPRSPNSRTPKSDVKWYGIYLSSVHGQMSRHIQAR